jgi:predicted signal transduction protein with EAL and GGDEF domain
MIDDFGHKLDAWVVTAGEELHREVLEVLSAAQTARLAGAQDESSVRQEVDAQASRLMKASARVEDLRAALWVPTEKVRVASSEAPPVPTAQA